MYVTACALTRKSMAAVEAAHSITAGPRPEALLLQPPESRGPRPRPRRAQAARMGVYSFSSSPSSTPVCFPPHSSSPSSSFALSSPSSSAAAASPCFSPCCCGSLSSVPSTTGRGIRPPLPAPRASIAGFRSLAMASAMALPWSRT